MDDNRVSPMEERALTNAIERAATVASINTSLDRDMLLANQLKKANIDPKFAKTASQAFNKRLTVLTFQKTADEHKADSFPLTDADKVYKLVAERDEEPIMKAASWAMSIDSTVDEPVMQKAASAGKAIPGYEYRVSMDTFEQHLDSMMDKYAAAYRDLDFIKMKLENTIEAEAEEVANIFKQAHYDYDFTTAVNLYGDKLKAAIGDKLDKSASFVQTSKFVIKPQKAIFNKVAKLIEDRESLQSITEFMSDYVTGLNEFCKSAAALSEEWQMKKVAAPKMQNTRDALDAATKDIADQTAALQGMLSESVDDGAFQARANALADLIAGGAASSAEAGIKGINAITGASRAALNNARALYGAGNNVSISPGDLLDAAFLTKDRYRDRLLAWSDMSADPQMALYPSEQVFQATNKAMDMDTALERPDHREVLRAQVAQLLAQNNRASTADVAALAATLKALAGARSNAAISGAEAVGKLSDKTAPERPDLEKIVGEYGDTEALHDVAENAQKDYESQIKKLDDINKTKAETRAATIKAVRESIEKAKGRQFQAQQALDTAANNRSRQAGELLAARAELRNQKQIAEARNQNALDIQDKKDKAALGRERLRHLDYRAYLDELAKQRQAGKTTTVNPPNTGSEKDDKEPEKKPKEPKKDKTPKEPKISDYDTPEKRADWFKRYTYKVNSLSDEIEKALKANDQNMVDTLQAQLDEIENAEANKALLAKYTEDQQNAGGSN